MARGKRKGKTEHQNPFSAVLDFVDTTDAIFIKLTGKSISDWLKEFQQPKALPPGGQQTTPSEPEISLTDAYSVLGLPQTATLEEVKRNYKNLAVIFHPDKGGYKEAMVLLNQAYERLTKERRE